MNFIVQNQLMSYTIKIFSSQFYQILHNNNSRSAGDLSLQSFFTFEQPNTIHKIFPLAPLPEILEAACSLRLRSCTALILTLGFKFVSTLLLGEELCSANFFVQTILRNDIFVRDITRN